MRRKRRIPYPRLRELPEDVRSDFEAWLGDTSRPLLVGVGMHDQDGYYPWDYLRWHVSLKEVKAM